jgi:DNA-binding CsgD family transcriptional regulator
MYSSDRYAALVDAIEALDEGVCVAERNGRVLYQNQAFRGMLAGGSDVRAIKESISDARSVALTRMHQLKVADGSAAQTSFAMDTHTAPTRFRVRCTVIRRPMEGDGCRETVVIWVRPVASHRVSLSELQARDGLTVREAHVATLIESGARTQEIARALGISIHTARRHAEAVLRKLGVRSRLEVRSRLRSDT